TAQRTRSIAQLNSFRCGGNKRPSGPGPSSVTDVCNVSARSGGRAPLLRPIDLLSSNRMRRGVHIAISLVAVFLLLKPFDCFSSGPFTRKAANCCKKGKCAPARNSDDCCKGTLPGGKQ